MGSIKKKQPPKGGVALFGGTDLFKGKNPFAHRRDDSEERDDERSRSVEPPDEKTNDEITVVESQSAMEQRLAKDKKDDKKEGNSIASDSPDTGKVWEVKEDQKAAAV